LLFEALLSVAPQASRTVKLMSYQRLMKTQGHKN